MLTFMLNVDKLTAIDLTFTVFQALIIESRLN